MMSVALTARGVHEQCMYVRLCVAQCLMLTLLLSCNTCCHGRDPGVRVWSQVLKLREQLPMNSTRCRKQACDTVREALATLRTGGDVTSCVSCRKWWTRDKARIEEDILGSKDKEEGDALGSRRESTRLKANTYADALIGDTMDLEKDHAAATSGHETLPCVKCNKGGFKYIVDRTTKQKSKEKPTVVYGAFSGKAAHVYKYAKYTGDDAMIARLPLAPEDVFAEDVRAHPSCDNVSGNLAAMCPTCHAYHRVMYRWGDIYNIIV